MNRNDHYISKVISACLLGDGFILKDDSGGRNRNGQFRIKQIEQHKDHLDAIASIIEPITSIKFDYVPANSNLIICGRDTKSRGTYVLRTQNHPFFTAMRSRWYNQIKVIDPHVCTLIDDELLAIWYMQDGYLKYNQQKDLYTPVLCTDCFTYGDLVMIRKAIIEKTGFIFNVQKRGKNINDEQTYRMVLSSKQFTEFAERIYPYLQESFYYKIQQRETSRTDEDIVCSTQ